MEAKGLNYSLSFAINGPYNLDQVTLISRIYSLRVDWTPKTLYWIEYCPPPSKLMSTQASECDLIWKQGLCRCN